MDIYIGMKDIKNMKRMDEHMSSTMITLKKNGKVLNKVLVFNAT